MELILLGTGTSQGIPVIGCPCHVCQSPDPRDKRLRTSAFWQVDKTGILIDIGPDFRSQMLDNQLDNVHAILITHEHNDHVSGLDDIRPVNFLHQRTIPIYAGERTAAEMKRRFYYAFDPGYLYPGKPRVTGITIDHHPFYIGDIEVVPIYVDHGDMSVFGFRIGRMAYVTDAKRIPEYSMQLLADLDVLVLNALRFASHPTHLNIEEALRVIDLLSPRQCYLTHISHEMGLHAEVEQKLPSGVHLGYDGLRIQVV